MERHICGVSTYMYLQILAICLTVFGSSDAFIWKRVNGPAKTLDCPNHCISSDKNEEDECCSCDGIPITKPTIDLFIEYVDLGGKSQVISISGNNINDTFVLIHTNGWLSRLPFNICNFRIFQMDLSFNKIETLDGLNCLDMLDTLTVKGNKLTYIANDTFAGMIKLRVLDLTLNKITYMEPGTLAAQGTEIFYVDLSENALESADVSNLFIENGVRCKTNLTNALRGIVTNYKNMTINENVTYTIGDVFFVNATLSYSQTLISETLSTFVDMVPSAMKTAMKVDAIGDLEFLDVTLPCDCQAGNLINSLKQFKRYFYTVRARFPGYRCESPPHMKNVYLNLTEILNTWAYMEDLVCIITDGLCPHACICIEQPYRNRFLVNCTARGLTKLPHRLPLSEYPYDLRFDSNDISTLGNRNYIERAASIDMSSNPVQNIPDDTIDTLRVSKLEMINFEDHSIFRLPKRLRLLNSSILHFGNNSVSCSCDDMWIKTWRKLTNVDKRNFLFCYTTATEQTISADDITERLLGCDLDRSENYTLPIILSCLAVLLSTMLLLLLFCKDDLRLASRHLSRHGNERLDLDLFVSFDVENSDIRRFICQDLYAELKRCKYQVIVPCIHILPGEETERATYHEMKRSRFFLVVLSSEYLYTPSTKQEFECIQYLYVSDRRRKCFFLNFENVKMRKFRDSPIRSMCRYNPVVDMVNRFYKIIPKIKDILGVPYCETTDLTQKPNFFKVFSVNSKRSVPRLKFNLNSIKETENTD